jgi:hypothetical protein
MRTFLLAFVLLIGISAAAFGQPVDTLSGHITTDQTLNSTTLYVLSGFVYVDSLVTLTIDPGTVILGEKATKGSLIVQRGAKIVAQGTPTKPIIFTSENPPGLRAAGDWGGIIILGNAPVNVPGGVAVIEGGVGAEYGGSDPADSSGVFSYVRIEFSGIAFLPNNEINGLTLGGVGNRTVIDHVQVSYNGDDSFEMFGGTVNLRNIVAYGSLDDDFDTDFGYTGKIQFALSIRDPNLADISSSNGFESDNDGTGTFNTPRTQPWFSNVTSVGPQADTADVVNPLYKRGAHLRRSTQTSIYNSIVMGWPVGLLIDGTGTIGSATGDTLQIRNSIWAGLKSGGRFLDTDAGAYDAEAWYFTPAYANRAYVPADSVGLIDPFNRTSPDPRPAPGSPAASGADFTNPRLADPFFIPTAYVGAFDPSLDRDEQWDAGWTEYNPNKYHVPSPIVVLSGTITTNTTLTNDKRYLLTGFVYVDSLVTLTIEPGTVIYGDKITKGSLIVERGAKIQAQGTPSAPIIFTSAEPIGARGPGDWGGVIILGNATINVPGGVAVIEGGVAREYGGPDDDDNSGVFSYVRIEYSGIAFLPNSEINGLTMGGVGRGTKIDHVQVSYNGDDAFEWFGGTVNASHLIALGSVDDDFDTDFGFRGKIQFALSIRDPNLADISSSNGFETDNDGTGTFNIPRTQPWFSNVTSIGPQSDTADVVNPNYRRGAHLRRSTQTSIYNSVVIGWPVGLLVDGTGTIGSATGDTLQIRNSIWAGLKSAGRFLDTDAGAFDAEVWYHTPAYANRSYILLDSVGLIDPYNVSSFDPRPAPGSPAASGADFTNPRLGDPFFVPTSYVGAFDPELPREYQWDYPWANYAPDAYNPVYHSFTLEAGDGWNLISVPVENLDDSAFTSIFPAASSSAYEYGAGYTTATHAAAGKGYWLKFTGAGSYAVPEGNQVLEATITMQEKWNMIGALGKSIPTANLQSDPPGNIISSIYAYDPGTGYTTVSTLEPGLGHWVKTGAAGTLTMSADAIAPYKTVVAAVDISSMDAVMVTDALGRSQTLYLGAVDENADLSAFELPPPPPQGNFDARFATQRMVAGVGSGRNAADIVLGSAVYPVTVSISGNRSGAAYAVASVNGRGDETVRALREGASVTVDEVAGGKLSIRLTGEASVPAVFALGRSYPNPFNPSTRFTVDVPMASAVEVAVYNVLGQKVATLFSGVREAGSAEMTWNGLADNGVSAPSGIYFIRMSAPESGFTAMQKVTFLK